MQKKIEDALSGAMFESADGADVKVQAKRTTSIISSAYADLIIATEASAKSGGRFCRVTFVFGIHWM